MKLRTGSPNEDIGIGFDLNKMTIGRRIDAARNALEKDFMPKYVNYIPTRGHLLNESTTMCQTLFSQEKVVLICDGTYIYVNKSRNYQFQKVTYTDQKKRNFVKVMMYVSSNGTILYAMGPFPANDNDAKILKNVDDQCRVFSMLRRGDILMLDRGFRDCVAHFENQGYEIQMPKLVQSSDKKGQLSTQDANTSRLVTATRYVVETRNGHLKTIFKIFNMVWSSLALPHLMVDIKICCAIINRYRKTFETNKGMAREIAMRMLSRINAENVLSKIVNTNSFTRILKKFELFHEFDDLPSLNGLDLIWIALGKYQIKQAESYCSQHIKDGGGAFNVFVLPDSMCASFCAPKYPGYELKLLMMQIKSRFRSQKYYNAFILVNMSGQTENVVLGYCCECYNGLRTVGCCSHVMSLIWFTLYSKDRLNKNPAGFLDDYFAQDFEIGEQNYDEFDIDDCD